MLASQQCNIMQVGYFLCKGSFAIKLGIGKITVIVKTWVS